MTDPLPARRAAPIAAVVLVTAASALASWAAFARTGNPNIAGLPKWPVYSAATRDTLLFNNEVRVVQDPDRVARVAMDQLLKLA